MKRLLTTVVVLLAAAVTVAGLSACGRADSAQDLGPSHPAAHAATPGLTLYSSLPMNSAQGQEIADGIMLVSGGERRVGRFMVSYRELSDTTGAAGWNQNRTITTASSAATDPHAALYVGDLSPHANALSTPILSQAGVAQLSPSTSGTSLTAESTFVALQVSPAQDAAAEAAVVAEGGCRRVVVTAPTTQPSATVLRADLGADLRARGLTVVADRALPQFETSLAVEHAQERAAQAAIAGGRRARGVLRQEIVGTGLAQRRNAQLSQRQALRYMLYGLNAQHAGCTVITGSDPATVAALARAVHSVLPHMVLDGDVPSCVEVDGELAPSTRCITSRIPLSSYTGSRAFLTQYHVAFGRASADALYGAQATELFFAAVRRLGTRAANRQDLLAALSGAEEPVIERYTFSARDRLSITFAAPGVLRGTPVNPHGSRTVALMRVALYHPVSLEATLVPATPITHRSVVRK